MNPVRNFIPLTNEILKLAIISMFIINKNTNRFLTG